MPGKPDIEYKVVSEWPFGIATDIAYVRYVRDHRVEILPGPALGLDARLEDTCATFKSPECLIVRASGSVEQGQGYVRWIVVTPGEQGYAYNVSYWEYDHTWSGGPTIPEPVKAVLTDNPYTMGWATDWYRSIQEQEDRLFIVRAWPRPIQGSVIAFVYAALAFWLMYEILRFLDGKTWAALVQGSSYLPLCFVVAYFAYYWIRDVRAHGDSEHPFREWKDMVWIGAGLVLAIGVFHYVLNGHFEKRPKPKPEKPWGSEKQAKEARQFKWSYQQGRKQRRAAQKARRVRSFD